MAAKKLSKNIRSDSSSNSNRTTEPRSYLGNYFPIRQRAGIISYGAWLQSYRAEQLHRFNTVLKAKIKSSEEIQKELRRRVHKVKSPKSSFTLDATYILKYCKADDPEDVFSLKIKSQGLHLADSEDFDLFTNLEYIDAEDNFLKFETFSSFYRLAQLKLPLNKLMDINLSLGEFPHLQYLDLSYNNLTGDCLPCLGLMPNLRFLNLGNNNITFMSLDSTRCFSSSGSSKVRYIRFPRLEVLKLDNNKLESPDIFIPLANIINLIYLDLEGNGIYHIPYLEKDGKERYNIPPTSRFSRLKSSTFESQPPDLKENESSDSRVDDDKSKTEKDMKKQKVIDENVEDQKPTDQTDKTLEDENLKCDDLSKGIHEIDAITIEGDRKNERLEVLHDNKEKLLVNEDASLSSREEIPDDRELFGSVEGLFTNTDEALGNIRILGSMEGLPGSREDLYGSREQSHGSKEGLLGTVDQLSEIKEDNSKESHSYDNDSQIIKKTPQNSRDGLDSSRNGLPRSREISNSSRELCGSREELYQKVEELYSSQDDYFDVEEDIYISSEGSRICTNEIHPKAEYRSVHLPDEFALRTSASAILNDLDSEDTLLDHHLSNDMILLEKIPSIEDLELFLDSSKVKETSELSGDEESSTEASEESEKDEVNEELLLPIHPMLPLSMPPLSMPPVVELDVDLMPQTNSQLALSEIESEMVTPEVDISEMSQQETEESEVSVIDIKSKTCDCYSARPVKELEQENIPFPQLTILNLAHNNIFCQAALMSISNWPMIQQVFLFGNPIMKNKRDRKTSIMTMDLSNKLGVDVFRKPVQELNEHHLEIQMNNTRKIKSLIRKVPKVPVEQLISIDSVTESVQISWEKMHKKSSLKIKSDNEPKEAALQDTLSSSDNKGNSAPVSEENRTTSSLSDKTTEEDADAQQKSTPFFVTQPKEDDRESSDTKHSLDTRKYVTIKKSVETEIDEDTGHEKLKEDLTDDNKDYTSNNPIKSKFKGYEMLFDDKSVNTKNTSTNDKLSNISELRRALKMDLPFKRRIPKNFTQELVLRSKESVSSAGNSFEERINKILKNIRDQPVLEEINLGEIFSNKSLYKEEYKKARKLLKQIENYYQNSLFNKRRQHDKKGP